MKDLKLSNHFMLSEFLRSSTASARGIDNTPGASAIGSMPAGPKTAIEIISNLQALCENVLEPLREFANSSPSKDAKGTVPIIISSGYRCPALNKAVGGTSNSNHLYGYAADIRIPDVITGKLWFNWMREHLSYDELILERTTSSSKTFWIHVAFRQDKVNSMKVIEDLEKKK